MHLRVFTELKGNTACTGAAAQQSTRVSVCENCRHFRMTHISNFTPSEEETPDILFSKHTREDSFYRYHSPYLNFTFALCSNLGTCAKCSFFFPQLHDFSSFLLTLAQRGRLLSQYSAFFLLSSNRKEILMSKR